MGRGRGGRFYFFTRAFPGARVVDAFSPIPDEAPNAMRAPSLSPARKGRMETGTKRDIVGSDRGNGIRVRRPPLSGKKLHMTSDFSYPARYARGENAPDKEKPSGQVAGF